MGNIIDINLLSTMPITKEFAELLFEDGKVGNIQIHNEACYIIFQNGHELLYFYDDGCIGFEDDRTMLRCAFQIVRYIDNYLNGLK